MTLLKSRYLVTDLLTVLKFLCDLWPSCLEAESGSMSRVLLAVFESSCAVSTGWQVPTVTLLEGEGHGHLGASEVPRPCTGHKSSKVQLPSYQQKSKPGSS